MDQIRIWGGHPLKGTIKIGGAKNAVLPLMAASLLVAEPLILKNVPHLMDTQTMSLLLEQHGSQVIWNEAQHELSIHTRHLLHTEAPYDIVRKMRASILVLGPLLARMGSARVSLPGGCAIGARSVEVHLKGLEALGATLVLKEGYIEASAPKGLKGASYTFPVVSVTGTENVMMAACLAEGTTYLNRVAREPEVVDLATCLNQMGARIEGAGTDTLVIEGVSSLRGTTYTVMPDRIEAGTYLMAAGITGGELFLEGVDFSLMSSLIPLLQQAGMHLQETPEGIQAKCSEERLKGVDVMTEPFPGLATDLQAQIMALLSLAEGSSLITETIFENRFMHVPELKRMGANIVVHGASALVRGVPSLKGAPVMATDLRASVCLVLAGLAAEGETVINRVYHLDRGYEGVVEKLQRCGAKIERLKND